MKQGLSFIVTDIEADGPDPGRHSMLSLASVAQSESGEDQGEFTVNLKPLPEAVQDADTMRWWRTHPSAWHEATRDQLRPEAAIHAWADWVAKRPGTPVFAAHPLSFDGAWVDWYLQKFTGRRLFYRPRVPGLTYGAGVDIPSLIMAKTGWGYQHCNRQNYPAAWFGGHDHSHRAIDDARGYAHLLRLILCGNVCEFNAGL
ncbi:DNA polymerase III subunit epsilon [Shinella sp. BYT-45]|uniref:DNA polymerase III subunit epsilon n=1 Tax=Shinella sp. BYT-45 TaxID=3377377 RepID=UPI00397EF3FA